MRFLALHSVQQTPSFELSNNSRMYLIFTIRGALVIYDVPKTDNTHSCHISKRGNTQEIRGQKKDIFFKIKWQIKGKNKGQLSKLSKTMSLLTDLV